MASEDSESLMSLPNSLDTTLSEGYDNEFVSPLDNKYECPICLMCLREPHQTACGHRFCKNCIQKWLRDSERQGKCPACNEILTCQKLYPDNFAKREVLALQAKCRFTKFGCDVVGTVKHIDQHQASCSFKSVQCPNECSSWIKECDLDSHVNKECPRRRIMCICCRQKIMAMNMESHLRLCAAASNSCTKCGQMLSLGNNDHRCSQDEVACRFQRFGCLAKCEPSMMAGHLQQAAQEHLCLMAVSIERFLDDPRTSTGAHGMLAYSDMALSEQMSRSSLSSPDDEHDVKEFFKPKLRSTSSVPGAEVGCSSKDPDDLAKSDSKANRGDFLTASETTVAVELRNQVASQQQYILELRSQVNRLDIALQNAMKEIRDSKLEIKNRCCNGVFTWRVHNYSRLRDEAKRGAPNCVLHSSGFYTSFNGYQFCIRLNLNGVENAQGTHLSLFIHLMQSENDDTLPWPFCGKITLSILDQNEVASKRNHISETLIAKPGLAAFQKPTTFRNHKGFGYMEFAPLSYIENTDNYYIVNDTMLVRAEVKLAQQTT